MAEDETQGSTSTVPSEDGASTTPEKAKRSVNVVAISTPKPPPQSELWTPSIGALDTFNEEVEVLAQTVEFEGMPSPIMIEDATMNDALRQALKDSWPIGRTSESTRASPRLSVGRPSRRIRRADGGEYYAKARLVYPHRYSSAAADECVAPQEEEGVLVALELDPVAATTISSKRSAPPLIAQYVKEDDESEAVMVARPLERHRIKRASPANADANQSKPIKLVSEASLQAQTIRRSVSPPARYEAHAAERIKVEASIERIKVEASIERRPPTSTDVVQTALPLESDLSEIAVELDLSVAAQDSHEFSPLKI